MSLLLLFLDTGGNVVPQVLTVAATSVSRETATLNGNVVFWGGTYVTRRGFQYNTVAYPDREVYEDGNFLSATYSLNITSGLTPGQTYYFRAFATNSVGTTYGEWLSFTCVASTYSITIAGTDRTADVIAESVVIEDTINDKQNLCNFSLIDLSGNGTPATDSEVIITLTTGTIIFGGYILSTRLGSVQQTGVVKIDISCVDYVRLFDRNLVHKTYESMTDKAIIADIVSTYCPGFGITTTNVVSGVTIDQISFNYLQPSQCLRRICDLTGRNWYIDYSKDIHYFPLATSTAPFNITTSSADYGNLTINKDASQLKNRIYVRGGTKLSDATSYETKGDGTKIKFTLPDKPHTVTVKVNGVTKTLGIKNIDTTGYDWYLNFQEKYVEQDSGGAVLATTDTLRVEYKYDIPILVAVENTSSIVTNGVKEFAIFDKSITTNQAARDRASAELTDYASSIIEGSFRTYTAGFISGQYININLAAYGINENYIVQKVTARAMGAGTYYYDIAVASAKTMGIIRFLIELLEANKNLVELDDDEVVDELLTLTDSLLSDSLLDSLTIDSAGAYATWCTSTELTPATRAVWGIFQWG